MNVGLTRVIDYWVGIPLCWLVSLWDKLFGRRTAWPRKPGKILFVELSEMGSAIIAAPVFRKARQIYPDAELFFLIFASNAESVELSGTIAKENIISIPDGSLFGFLWGALQAMARVRRLKIDTVIDLELFSRCTALLSYFSGACTRVGFYRYTTEGLYRGTFLTHRVQYSAHQHISRSFMALLVAAGEDPGQVPLLKRCVLEEDYAPLRVTVSEDERAEMRARVKRLGVDLGGVARFVLLNPDPGPAIPIRAWPLERYAELASRLVAREQRTAVAVIGLSRSRLHAEFICRRVAHALCVDFTGKTEFMRELLALYSLADLLVTNDSGPAQLAALSGVRSLAFFGPETSRLYGPLGGNTEVLEAGFSCSPCLSAFNHRKAFCTDNRCVQAFTVDDVLKRALQVLESAA